MLPRLKQHRFSLPEKERFNNTLTKHVQSRGLQAGNGPVELLQIDKGKSITKETLDKIAITKDCLEKVHGQTTVQTDIGDSYNLLQRASGRLLRRDLKFGFLKLKEIFDEIINTTDEKTRAKAFLFMTQFVGEALRVSLVEDSIVQNIQANGGEGETISEDSLKHEHGWGRASLCLALRIFFPKSLSLDGIRKMNLLDMRNCFGVLLRINNIPTKSSSPETLNMTRIYATTV